MTQVNQLKSIEINDDLWKRYAVQTHFVTTDDSYLDIIKKYVLPIYRPGDIVSISEKIISLCQGKVITRSQLPIGLGAKFLSHFADHTYRGGHGVSEPIKMQYAIYKVGWPRILLAAVVAGIGKLFGIKGIFYVIAGRHVSGIDGFYAGAWEQYRDIGIELPDDPEGVCQEIYETYGVSCMIVDANDLGQVILGRSSDITLTTNQLLQLIADNPAGQEQQRTPLIVMRKVGVKCT